MITDAISMWWFVEIAVYDTYSHLGVRCNCYIDGIGFSKCQLVPHSYANLEMTKDFPEVRLLDDNEREYE